MHMPVIMPHTEQVVTAVGLLASQQVGFTEAVGVVLGDPVSREEAPRRSSPTGEIASVRNADLHKGKQAFHL
jgi:hypothetical protein